MVAIGVDQSSSNSALYEHRRLGKTKELYKTTGKGEDQHQYKPILGEAMVSTPEGFNNNSLMTPNQSKSMKIPIQENHSDNLQIFWMSNIGLLFVG